MPLPRCHNGAMVRMILAVAVLLVPAAGLMNGCVLLLAGGAGAEAGYVGTQKERTAGQTMSDQWIHTKVKSALIANGKVKARRINVDVHKGIVTLTGLVGSADEKETAINLAKSVKGVIGVQDKLLLEPKSPK